MNIVTDSTSASESASNASKTTDIEAFVISLPRATQISGRDRATDHLTRQELSDAIFITTGNTTLLYSNTIKSNK